MPGFLILMKSELLVTLIIFILLLFKLGKGLSNERLLSMVQILLLINVLISVVGNTNGSLFGSLFLNSPLIGFQKTMLSLGVYLISLSFSDWLRKLSHLTEFFVLILSSLLGMYFLLSSGNLLMLYLSLELSTLPVTALANFELEKKKSSEAAMKLILSSAFSSGILLFGISLFYGATGSLEFDVIGSTGVIAGFSVLALVFIFSAFAFKLSVVPFHLWTADVYEGSPLPVTAYLSVISKGTMAFVLLTLLFKVFSGYASVWHWLLIAFSLATMIVGNLFAIRQQNIKRFLAFSSIAQVGFILVGMVGVSVTATAAVTYFILVYLFSNLAAFVVAGVLYDRAGIEEIKQLKGLRKSNPFLAWMLALAVFSLAGIPPAAGFFGKIFLIGTGAYAGHVWFILIAALNMVVSLYYYLQIVKLMFMEDADQAIPVLKTARSDRFTLIICTAGILLGGVFSWIYDYIQHISM